MQDFRITLKFRNGGVKTVHVLALDIFVAWHQAVSIFGGVVCD